VFFVYTEKGIYDCHKKVPVEIVYLLPEDENTMIGKTKVWETLLSPRELIVSPTETLGQLYLLDGYLNAFQHHVYPLDVWRMFLEAVWANAEKPKADQETTYMIAKRIADEYKIEPILEQKKNIHEIMRIRRSPEDKLREFLKLVWDRIEKHV
jgi:hypothetical protein